MHPVIIYCIEICCSLVHSCAAPALNNSTVWHTVHSGIFNFTEVGCACPFHCYKVYLHKKAVNEVLEGIRMGHMCAARPGPGGSRWVILLFYRLEGRQQGCWVGFRCSGLCSLLPGVFIQLINNCSRCEAWSALGVGILFSDCMGNGEGFV